MMLLLAAGCEMFPEDESIAPQEGAVPTIATADVGDNGFKVTITPAEGTGFYGYLITDKRANVTGTGLTSVSYEGIVSGNADATDEKTSALEIVFSGKTVTVNNGKPAQLATTIQAGTKYYIYAAGNSEQGIASVVAADSVWTTDATAPDLSKSKVTSTDTSVVIAMNTVVKRGTGKVYYTVYDATGDAVANLSKIEAPASTIKVDGKNVAFHTPDSVGVKPNRIPTPGGAIIGLSWDEGAFTNCAQEPKAIAALDESKPEDNPLDYYDIHGVYGKSGVIYRVPVKPWNIIYKSTGKNAANKAIIREDKSSNLPLGEAQFVSAGQLKIAKGEVESTMTLSYENAEDAGLTTKKMNLDYSQVITKDSLISVGSLINPRDIVPYMTSITIPEGAMYDVYGNPNAEFQSNYNFVQEATLKVETLAGTYALTATGVNPEDGSSSSKNGTVTITALPKEVSFGGLMCNIEITGLVNGQTKALKAMVYEELNQIWIPVYQEIGIREDVTVEGYPDTSKDPVDGKYPDKVFDATLIFDTPNHGNLILSVDGTTISVYSAASVYSANATWQLDLKDHQTTVATEYTVSDTKLAKN